MDWSKTEVKGKIRTHCQSHWPQSKSVQHTRSPLLCLHNWLQAFGICHFFWNLICKQRKAGEQSSSSHFCQNSDPTPCQLPWIWGLEKEPSSGVCSARLQLTRGAVKSGWNAGGYGGFALMLHNFQTNLVKTMRKSETVKTKVWIENHKSWASASSSIHW